MPKSIFALFIFLVFASTSEAISADYPYSGYFSVNTYPNDPRLYQAKCGLAFFQQGKDGIGRDFIIDIAEFKKSGKVSYRQTDKTNCSYNASNQSDKCHSVSFDSTGETSNDYYDYIEPISETGGDFFSFSNENELNRYLNSTTKAFPSIFYFTAQKTHLHRCVGFSDEAISPLISSKKNNLSPAETAEILWKAPEQKDFSLILDVMQSIGGAASNATLPGQ